MRRFCSMKIREMMRSRLLLRRLVSVRGIVDNWGNRSFKCVCLCCMYYHEKTSTAEKSIVVGRCRRRAPTVSGWPVVFPTDTCGDHKIDENKIREK